MKIAAGVWVSLEYALSTEGGEEVDRTEPGEPMGFVFAPGAILPGLERGLLGLEQGAELSLELGPEEGFGPAQPDMCLDLPRDRFPADARLEPGMQFAAQGPHGPMRCRVVSLSADEVRVDFNHPLAGQRLRVRATVLEVRAPTAEELAEHEAAQTCGHGGCCDSGCSSCG
ncbi:MAG TPA: peptidylprolyl isomerase [Myxococcota bacterium]|nr:peptidylprolyl isomerase [Myxococcota bacterium]HRY95199.1 peptidylprolyl isomerase [Myxococcota bacterium]HSA20512.1 peptidylprolyl isomerase [Myxococcota bacterium]